MTATPRQDDLADLGGSLRADQAICAAIVRATQRGARCLLSRILRRKPSVRGTRSVELLRDRYAVLLRAEHPLLASRRLVGGSADPR